MNSYKNLKLNWKVLDGICIVILVNGFLFFLSLFLILNLIWKKKCFENYTSVIGDGTGSYDSMQ